MDKNVANEGVISMAGSRVAVRVIHTDEEQMLARSVCRALGLGLAGKKLNFEQATKYSSRLEPFSKRIVPP